jgi:DNA-binding PadR family transcriptional regulator
VPAAKRQSRRAPRPVTREAVAEVSRVAEAEAAAAPTTGRARGGDPFSGELRRREVLPLLVLHLIAAGPSYGNQLMDRISELTAGVLSVNPNTMYPLLRQLEARGLIEGRWEHPERRSRRYYSLTKEGRVEHARLVRDVRPFLDSVARSISEIVREVYEP